MSHLFTSKVTLIGLGSQGIAWALNLRDSGFEVEVALRKESSKHEMLKDLELEEAKKFSSVLLLLIPDDQHTSFLQEHQEMIEPGTAIVYAHGASILESALATKYPQFNHLLLAPKSIASEVRFQYEIGGKLGACYSVEYARPQDEEACEILIKNLSKGIGITAGPYPTSFAHEAKADLFSEQSLLCGLLPYAAKTSFDFLIKKGISPEVAYMECWHEVKLIATAMVDNGPSEFFSLISPHALSGADKAQQMFFDKKYQDILEQLYKDIESLDFFAQAQKVNKDKVIGQWKESDLQNIYDKLAPDLSV